MKKYIIVVVFFIHQIYSSQIKMKVKIIEKREVYINKYNKKTPEYLLQITLDNQSKKDYIIPIDTTGYRTYMLDNKCNDFFMMDYYPDLGITPKIYKDNFLLEGDGAYLQGRMGDEEWNRRKKEQERRKNKKKKEAKLWMKKYKIKENYDYIIRNKYLFENIKTLKVGEKIVYVKKFNPFLMNYDSFFETHDFHLLEEGRVYKIYFEFCIEEAKYNYLTPQQKEKYKDYKFFTGKIISNEVEI